MSTKESVLDGPCFVLVTGASKGYGRALAVALASRIAAKSVIAVTARNTEGLKETAKLIQNERHNTGCEGCVETRCVTADLSNKKDMVEVVEKCVSGLSNKDFSSAVLIHNAGTVGDISKKLCDFDDPSELQSYMEVNVTHLPFVTSGFLKWFSSGLNNQRTFVINISSLLAIQPSAHFGFYCTGKAARDMMLQVLAIEHPNVRFLNWAPGPLKTEMSATIYRVSKERDINPDYVKMTDDGHILTCEASAKKFMEILLKNEFASGSHVDIYD